MTSRPGLVWFVGLAFTAACGGSGVSEPQDLDGDG
jgi:hypothetical protein